MHGEHRLPEPEHHVHGAHRARGRARRRGDEAERDLRRLGIALLTTLVAGSAAAQSSPYKKLRVRSCAYADSLLGPLRDDFRAGVLGFHHKERDSTYVVTDMGGDGKPRFDVSIKIAGERPGRDVAAQLVMRLRGNDARAVRELGRTPTVRFVLNDNVTVEPSAVALGTFIGPTTAAVTLPLSALLPSDDFVTMAHASSIAVNAEVVTLVLTADERRALRAILRVAVCPG